MSKKEHILSWKIWVQDGQHASIRLMLWNVCWPIFLQDHNYEINYKSLIINSDYCCGRSAELYVYKAGNIIRWHKIYLKRQWDRSKLRRWLMVGKVKSWIVLVMKWWYYDSNDVVNDYGVFPPLFLSDPKWPNWEHHFVLVQS